MPERIRRWLQETGDTYLLGLVRMCLGALLFWHALTAARELETRGYFGDHFHLAILPESLVPSRAVYTVLVAARLLGAVLITVGSLIAREVQPVSSLWCQPSLEASSSAACRSVGLIIKAVFSQAFAPARSPSWES